MIPPFWLVEYTFSSLMLLLPTSKPPTLAGETVLFAYLGYGLFPSTGLTYSGMDSDRLETSPFHVSILDDKIVHFLDCRLKI